MFESCVVSDGNQTYLTLPGDYDMFESCVVSDGNQTKSALKKRRKGLRVVLFLMVTKQSALQADAF